MKLPSTNSPLVLIIQEKEAETERGLETVQPPCSIIGFIELATSQRVYTAVIDRGGGQSLCSVSAWARGGGAC